MASLTAFGDLPLDLQRVGLMARHILDGGSPGSFLGCAARDYEALYAVGHALYMQSRYEDAGQVFRRLTTYEPMNRRFLAAYAAALQMQERHDEAMVYHSLSSLWDLDDPVPTFHTCECLIARGRRKEAAEGLAMAIRQCVPGLHDKLRERAQALLELIDPQQACEPGREAS